MEQAVPPPAKPPTKWKYTGQRLRELRPDVYRQVAELVAAKTPYSHIVKQLHVHRATCAAIEREESIPIAVRKQELLRSYARIAARAVNHVEDNIDKLGPRDAIVTAAIATDKLLLLTGDPTIRIEHTIEPGPNLYDRLNAITSDLRPVLEATLISEPARSDPASGDRSLPLALPEQNKEQSRANVPHDATGN